MPKDRKSNTDSIIMITLLIDPFLDPAGLAGTGGGAIAGGGPG